ncbi:MAG TPA: ABC transporter permease [Gemmatimonadales bacterium]|nr:ABC transporter permease [Gemmatimonadales bacterium]
MTILQDARYAFRTLRKSPGFTAIAVLTLGLGIGANTAIFSVINAVLLRPLPYREPDRLITIFHHYPSLSDLHASVSVAGFLAYQARKDILQSAAVENGWGPTLTDRGEPTRIQAVQVTGDYFTVLGVPTELGPGMRAEDATTGKDKVVVVSHGFWQRMLGGDPKVIGQSLRLNGESYQIVGVMPPTFRDFFGRGTELWAPLVFRPGQDSPDRWTNEFLSFTGRLAPGVSLKEAADRFAAYGVQLRTDTPSRFSPDWGLLVVSLNEQAAQGIRRALLVLLGAVLCVLLIACANVANLQLARAAGRGREIGVRVALGASPRNLISQLLTESVLLALMGGVLGVGIAVWGVPALLSLNAGNLPPAGDLRLDARVLGFALGLSVVTGLLFGLAPAIRVSRSSLQETLKEGGRGAAGDRGGLALRRGLVIATVALALLLLVGAGLLLKSFARLVGVDPGFQPARMLTFNLALPTAKYPSDTVQAQVWERITDQLAAVPGVVSVGGTSVMPFTNNFSTSSFSIEGQQTPPGSPGPWGDYRIVTPGFFDMMKLDLLAGRRFTAADRAGSAPVAIVDEDLAHRYFPHESAIGKRITYDGASNPKATWIEIVGVVRHALQDGLDGNRRVQVYTPLPQNPIPFMTFGVRTRGAPEAVLPAVSQAVHQVDPDLALSGVSNMEDLIEASTGPRRFSMVLLSLFSGLAAALAAIGLYGVMAYSVTQRAQELGVRLALGAERRDVLRLVLGQGMRLVGIGVAIGLAASLLFSQVLKKMLFNVSATDPLTYAAIVLLLVGVTVLATWLPARRAARTDPLVAIRAE